MKSTLNAFRSEHSLSKLVIILLAASALVTALHSLAMIALIEGAMSETHRVQTAPASQNTPLDALNGALNVIQLLLYGITLIPFLIWAYRTHSNRAARGVQNEPILQESGRTEGKRKSGLF